MLIHNKISHRDPDQECHVCQDAFKTTLLLASHYLKTHKEQQFKKCCFKATGKDFYNHKKVLQVEESRLQNTNKN